jgi:hypothetical protein
MHELAIIKLITGETLICKMSLTKDKNYVLIVNPLQLALNSNQSGSSLVASKWIETDQTEFKVKTWHIVAAAEPSLYIKEIYDESMEELNDREQDYNDDIAEQNEIDYYLDRMMVNNNDDFNVH